MFPQSETNSFLEAALQSNIFAGDPFLQYLVRLGFINSSLSVNKLCIIDYRAGEESYVIIYQLWMEINEVLSNQAEYTNYEIQNRYMKIYAKYCKKHCNQYDTKITNFIDATPLTSFAVFPETIEPEVFHEKLFNLQVYCC